MVVSRTWVAIGAMLEFQDCLQDCFSKTIRKNWGGEGQKPNIYVEI